MLWRCWLLLLLLLSVPSCYSLILHQEKAILATAEADEVIEVTYWQMVGYRNMYGRQGGNALGAFVGGVFTWPFDVVFSSVQAVLAIPNPKVDVWMGPLGAAGGILLPGLTLMPPLKGSHVPVRLDLESENFQSLMRAVRDGQDAVVIELIRDVTGTDPYAVTIELVTDPSIKVGQ